MIIGMIYGAILASHIIGAALTGMFAMYAGAVLARRTSELYRMCALILAIIASFEVISGTVLSVVSNSVSALSLCANIALYLSLVGIVEFILFMRMNKTIGFPLAQTLSPVIASLLLFSGVALQGF